MISKILLADDETIFRKTFTKVLQEEGMAVTTVDNGTDAIDAITKQLYAVVILDIQMPGADGIKVLREIMRTRPQTRVIMITAYGSIEMAVEAIKLGACDYVMKPVVFEDILAKIRQHLRYLELQEENQELKRELDGIHLPALQERKDDIPLLIEHFIKKYNAEMGKHCVGISDDAMRLLMGCEWKGNIRELENVIERAVIFAESDVIETCDIGLIGVSTAALSGKNENLRASLKAYEKEQIYRVLNKYDWNKAEAAKALGVGLSSLYRKIDELGINVRKHKKK